ncbi:glycosyltransferase family 2 protein [Burkholderia anthina]|nr:glycosyltransferase family 2 protein [Burkholderia anthina]RQX84307.1 glycosyltransferase family 2 protein [Burkholderia anthina]
MTSFSGPRPGLISAAPDSEGLSVSIVTYHPDKQLLEQTLSSLSVACSKVHESRPDLAVNVWLIDNGGDADPSQFADTLREAGLGTTVLTGQGNVGYGRGHNLSIDATRSRYHLVLNPDIDLDPDVLVQALDFLEAHQDIGLLAPRIGDKAGQVQYLCRRFPSLVDLFIRGFLPTACRQIFNRRLSRYEMRDLINDHDIVWDPPIISGCFMLFRTDVLKRLGGFDPRYFLYFEDYDLSLRTHDVARVAYVPSVRVIHHGGGASRKGFAHIRMFAASAFKFYNRFGWRLW